MKKTRWKRSATSNVDFLWGHNREDFHNSPIILCGAGQNVRVCSSHCQKEAGTFSYVRKRRTNVIITPVKEWFEFSYTIQETLSCYFKEVKPTTTPTPYQSCSEDTGCTAPLQSNDGTLGIHVAFKEYIRETSTGVLCSEEHLADSVMWKHRSDWIAAGSPGGHGQLYAIFNYIQSMVTSRLGTEQSMDCNRPFRSDSGGWRMLESLLFPSTWVDELSSTDWK